MYVHVNEPETQQWYCQLSGNCVHWGLRVKNKKIQTNAGAAEKAGLV